jgi:hypothetical protein
MTGWLDTIWRLRRPRQDSVELLVPTSPGAMSALAHARRRATITIRICALGSTV